jgi:hypothetical protein
MRQQVIQTNEIKQTDPDNKFRRVLSASTLAGDSVRNGAGEDLGKIDEIMIDIPTRKTVNPMPSPSLSQWAPR